MATQVLTHLPLTWTSHVPHSPFLHLYLMNWSAWDATGQGRADLGARHLRRVALLEADLDRAGEARVLDCIRVVGELRALGLPFPLEVLAWSKVGWRGRSGRSPRRR